MIDFLILIFSSILDRIDDTEFIKFSCVYALDFLYSIDRDIKKNKNFRGNY